MLLKNTLEWIGFWSQPALSRVAYLGALLPGLENTAFASLWKVRAIRGGCQAPEDQTPSLHSCSVFLLDQNELVAKVFDGGVVDDEVSDCGGSMWP